MAITFFEKEKRQRNLILVFIVIVLITALTLWIGYFKPEKTPTLQVPPPIEKLEIDFEILKNPFLEELQIFEELPILPEEEIGRENPFIPY